MSFRKAISKKDRQRVRAVARELLARARIQTVPVDLEKLALAQGVRAIVYEDLQGPDAELVRSSVDMVIKVDPKPLRSRQRFSIAHEIAHSFFHPRNKAYRSASIVAARWADIGYRTEEELCDIAAAELLMPTDLFIREIREGAVSIAEITRLANLFETSVLATASRFAELCGRAVQLNRWTLDNGQFHPWGVLGRRLVAVYPFSRPDRLDEAVAQAFDVQQLITREDTDPYSYPHRLSIEARGFGRGEKRYVLSLIRSSRHF